MSSREYKFSERWQFGFHSVDFFFNNRDAGFVGKKFCHITVLSLSCKCGCALHQLMLDVDQYFLPALISGKVTEQADPGDKLINRSVSFYAGMIFRDSSPSRQ